MHVKELIERLQKCDPNSLIFCLNKEGDLELKEFASCGIEESFFYEDYMSYSPIPSTLIDGKKVKGIIL